MELTPPLLAPETLARLERLVQLARRSTPARRRQRVLKLPGRGVEPGSRRDYTPGDDLRLLDWPAYARLERLLVKVTEELPEPRLELLLDGSASMAIGEPSPLLRSSLALAALAAAATAREVRVTAWWAGEQPTQSLLSRPGELVRLLRFLAPRVPTGPGRLLETAERLANRAKRRGGAVILTDGLGDELLEAARRLRQRGFDLLVVLAEPADELSPDLAAAADDAGWAELVDAETGERKRVASSRTAQVEARAKRAERLQDQASGLEEAGIPCESLRSDAPFEAVALSLLR